MRNPPGGGAGIAAVTSVAGWGSSRGSRQGASCKRTAPPAIAPKGDLGLTTSEDGSGEGGIRTLEAGISPPNALAGRRLQPLGHFSEARIVSQHSGRESPRAAGFRVKRRERDLNPRCTFQHIRDFQSRSFGRSDTPPGDTAGLCLLRPGLAGARMHSARIPASSSGSGDARDRASDVASPCEETAALRRPRGVPLRRAPPRDHGRRQRPGCGHDDHRDDDGDADGADDGDHHLNRRAHDHPADHPAGDDDDLELQLGRRDADLGLGAAGDPGGRSRRRDRALGLPTRRRRSGVSPNERRRRLDGAVASWAAQGWALESQSTDTAVLQRSGERMIVGVDSAGHISTRPY